jgi:ribosome biogenesis GTPase
VSLFDYGWSTFFENSHKSLNMPECMPGRVLFAGSSSYRVVTEAGERQADLAGKLAHSAGSPADLPAVGDWVVISSAGPGAARIEQVLPRRTRLSRKTAGSRTEEQVIAANMETVILVMGLDADYSIRRVERFLATIVQSGADPVIALNKVDLCPTSGDRLEEIRTIAPGRPVLLTNCLRGEGVKAVEGYIKPRETAVLVGSSGAGKSTLINQLLGRSAQKTLEVRSGDGKGRHTTTHREMFRLGSGGLLIDNPGIRELQLWVGDQSLDKSFPEISSLAERCRFRDCTHNREPGCAVLAALKSGDLATDRLDSYRKLQKEIGFLESRKDDAARREGRRKDKGLHRLIRRTIKHKRR